jgi:hypothetical protein
MNASVITYKTILHPDLLRQRYMQQRKKQWFARLPPGPHSILCAGCIQHRQKIKYCNANIIRIKWTYLQLLSSLLLQGKKGG